MLTNRDFDGAEVLLTEALARAPELATFVHLQFSRMYREWNKLTSAVDHLNRAAECAGGDAVLRAQIIAEFEGLRARREAQRP